MTRNPILSLSYPMYTDHIRPKGFLTYDKKTHALFHYYLLCQKLLERAGNSIEDQRFRTYEGNAWMDKPYGNIANGVAMRYGLESPDEFLQPELKHVVQLEVARLGFPEPAGEYWNVTPGKVVEV